MRLVLLTILSTIVLSSCSLQRRIDKACKLCPHKDSIAVKTMIERFRYDSLIYITTPPDTLRIASPCDSNGNLKSFDVVQNNHGIKIHIKSVGNQIIAEVNADSLSDNVKGLNTNIKESINETETNTIVTNDCPESWWQTLYRVGFWIYTVISLALIIFTIIKLYLKIK